ncbi:hypothetical protein ACROYT_G035071 [Oculina patagonica]
MYRLDRKNENEDGDLCKDVTLVAENGKEFKAHMHVLSEASPFFEKIFNSNMKESMEGVVRLEILTESQMANLLEFIYTGSIKTLTQEKAEDLIAVADYLCLESLKSVAQKFLEQTLSTSNCISYYYLAEKYMCEELIASCRKIISLIFTTFAESEDFLNLSSQEVAKWISSDDIVINEEEDVFKILLKWINQEKSERRVKFAELFSHVRLTYDWRRLPAIECHEEEPYSPTDLSRIIYVDTYRGQLFAIFDDIYRSQCYDPDMNQWYPAPWAKSDPNQALVEDGQCLDAVLVVKDEICFIFKLFGIYYDAVGKLFRYSFDSNSFSLSLNWVERHNSCVVPFDKYIYAIGGYTLYGRTPVRSSVRSEAARFDTVENKWEKIADIQEARLGAFGVAANDKIFIAGGVEKNMRKLNTCEVYNIMTDEWEFMTEFMGSLTVPRSQGNMLLVNETLYVLGGYREDERDHTVDSYWDGSCASTVECYDHEKDEWNEKTVIPPHEGLKYRSFTFKACSLNVFKGSVNNLIVVGASGGIDMHD